MGFHLKVAGVRQPGPGIPASVRPRTGRRWDWHISKCLSTNDFAFLVALSSVHSYGIPQASQVIGHRISKPQCLLGRLRGLALASKSDTDIRERKVALAVEQQFL